MSLNLSQVQQHLLAFDFATLFNELGWENPSHGGARPFTAGGADYERRMLAQLSAGVPALEITAADGAIPDARTRRAVHSEIAKLFHENLLIFVDRERTQSLWYWVKREDKKAYPREHTYLRGQATDLMLSKLAGMEVDLSELDESGRLGVFQAAGKLKAALDVEKVTKKFYGDFQQQHEEFIGYVQGIADERQRRWYASVLLNRLMFIYFLQRKGFLYVDARPDFAADTGYLQRKLADSHRRGADLFYREFLQALFFVGFAKPEADRTAAEKRLLGDVPYLNGGLFLPHQIETDNLNIFISDEAFVKFFALLQGYSWNLDDTPTGHPDEINPDVLGYIFEKYINQKAFGAYYTRPEITGYLCEQTIHKLILDKANALSPPSGKPTPGHLFGPPERDTFFNERRYDSLADLLMNLDGHLCGRLFHEWLPELKLLDPACGSGAFLVAALKTLINIYSAVIGKSEFVGSAELRRELAQLRQAHHGSLNYFIKKRIITDNLYGVDVMEEATEIAKLRLFLALVASIRQREQLEPLPNIDFNLMAGNSLIGLTQVNAGRFDKLDKGKQGSLLDGLAAANYEAILADKNRSIELYRQHAFRPDNAHGLDQDVRLAQLREHIEKLRRDSYAKLNQLLWGDFRDLKIKYEQAVWDEKKGKEGKPEKRSVALPDIETLRPFHWGFEFPDIINRNGGFDAIITNPPWEIFKPQAKEFFAEHSELVTKNKMTIKEFEKKQTELLRNEEIRAAWLEYLSRYPHISLYFRTAPQYKNQIAIVNGKKAGTDINLYKLFLEQCFNLLRPGGRCGIIVPTGIYTDLGATQLREVLFSETRITSLFGLANEKFIFEGVHHAFKFALLTFEKLERTDSFRAAFRINPREALSVNDLDGFFVKQSQHIEISVPLIRRLSPQSLSIIEFRNEQDVKIAEKMSKYPLLGEPLADTWNVRFNNEFHMTNDSYLFKTSAEAGRLPLYEGKMIDQYSHNFAAPRYWIEEKEGRKALFGRHPDNGQCLDYQDFRIGLRRIASSTNERTVIATILPANHFASESFHLSSNRTLSYGQSLAFAAVLNSFVLDYCIRQRVSQNLSMFYIYQLPVPRLTEKDGVFAPIVRRAARLICTAPEFDELARAVGLGDHTAGATNAVERARLRAELDGLIAHLYGLTEDEFTYILTTFPLVSEIVKVAAQNAYRDVERGLIK